MNIEERQLITNVFEQIGRLPDAGKDLDAEQLIRESIVRMPDAPYRLVQSVLVQQQEMHRLEERVRDLEWAAQLPRASRDGVSFLAPSPAAASGSSVPQVGSRYRPEPEDERPPPAPQAPGFLTSALTTATGVAGGMLLTDGLRKIFGGGGQSNESSSGLIGWDRSQDELRNARADVSEAHRQLAEDDAALDEAQDELDTRSNDAWDFGEA